MRRLTLAAGIVAMALTAPFALAQTVPNPDTAPTAGSTPGNASGPGMMSGQVQGQGGYGRSMMGVYGAGWMGGYGGVWVPSLLVLLGVGLGVWVVKQKTK